MVDRFAFSEATVWKINPFGNWVRVNDYEAIEKKAGEASAQLDACRSLNASLRVDIEALRARLETVEAETRERLSNELDPEIGLPSDARLRNIHADLEMRGRKHPDFAVTVHHRNIVLSAVAAELRNLEPRHD